MTTDPVSGLDQFNIHEAKTQLSQLAQRVEQGEEILLCRSGTPIAKIIPLHPQAQRTARGSLTGILILDDQWDSAQTNAEIAESFGIEGPAFNQPQRRSA